MKRLTAGQTGKQQMQTRSYRSVTVNPAIINGKMKFDTVIFVKEGGTEREVGRSSDLSGIVAHFEALETERQKLVKRRDELAKQVVELMDRAAVAA